ncbi:hypothetical protein [Bernardetia sp.]|uniref:hypothetical protein n=1 Tax=Bernardetia sp. TaxID=1937974 RepID=UPI0025B872B0|nr:hypothetical protein [Bernardetia sp.]
MIFHRKEKLLIILSVIITLGFCACHETTKSLSNDNLNSNTNKLISEQSKVEKKQTLISEYKRSNGEKTDIKYVKDTVIIDSEPVYDFEFYLTTEIENWYNKNYKKQVNSNHWELANIYSRSNTESKLIGKMITYYDTLVSNYIIQVKTIDGKVKKEFREIGDWGYGIHINIVAHSEHFVQLPEEYFGKEAWVLTQNINGNSESYRGSLVELSANELIEKDTRKKVEIKQGVYLIEAFENSKFVIRKEIPEDMPCGDDILKTNEIKNIPRYYLDIEKIKLKNGDFDVKPAYPRGC